MADDATTIDDPTIDPGTEGTPDPTPPAKSQEITSIDQIPQELRNKIESQHRRGLQTKVQELAEQNKTLGQLKEQSAAFLDLCMEHGIEFEEGSQLDQVAKNVMGTLDGLKSEQERLTAANQKKAEEIENSRKQAEILRNELFDTLITNQLMGQLGQNEAGQPRCVSPKSAELIAKELKQFAKVDDNRNITFEMKVTDPESGTAQTKQLGAAEAVTQLESDAAWSSFFTATVNSGAGGEVIDDVKRVASGDVDIAALANDPKKFFEIMEKNPELIDKAMEKTRAV